MSATRRVPQREKGLITQGAVIEGAARVFDEVGYGIASLSAIAAASGVSQGSMYFHFKSKEQIALAVVNEQHARSIALIADPGTRETPVVERLIRVSFAVASQLVDDVVVRAGMRLALEDGALAVPARSFYEEWVQSTAELIRSGLDKGELASRVDATWLARTLIGFFTGVHVMSQATSQRSDLFEAVASMWWVLIDSIVAVHRRADALSIVAELAQSETTDPS